MKVQGTTALVTGANRGIGKAIAEELLARGAAKVYAAVRDVASVTDPRLTAVQLDITDPKRVAAVASEVGDVDLVVNNAGIGWPASPLSATLDDARAELETNYLGLISMTQAFAPVLAARGGGAFVNLLSVVSWVGMPYNAQRAAISGFVGTVSTHPMHHLILDASVTNVYEALDLVTDTRLERNPVFQTELGLTRAFDNGPISFGVRFSTVGSTGDDLADLVPPQTNVYDNYTLVDAFVSYKLFPHMTGTFRAFNLGNERYAPIFGYPAPGRAIEFELSAN